MMRSASGSPRASNTRLNQYFVILEVEPDFQLGPNALSRNFATSSSGTEVPLSEFAKITSTVAPPEQAKWRLQIAGGVPPWLCGSRIAGAASPKFNPILPGLTCYGGSSVVGYCGNARVRRVPRGECRQVLLV
jgi:hypothetical protein